MVKRNESESEPIAPTRVTAYVDAVTISERIVLRIKDEMDARDISQRDLAEILTRRTDEVWTQSRVGKVLNLRVALRVEDVATVAAAVGLSLVEVVRDPGLEFYADMTPTELRLFQMLKRKPKSLDAVLQLVIGAPKPESDETLALPPKQKIGRPLNSATTKAQKEAWPEKKPGKTSTAPENKPRKVSKREQHGKATKS